MGETRITPPAAPTQNEADTPLADRASTPPAVVSDALIEQRQELRTAMSKVLTSAKVTAVLDALYDRAVGDDEALPSIQAMKLWLEYAVGSPAALDVGEAKRATPSLTDEEFQRLEAVAQRFEKDLKSLRHVKVVENYAPDRDPSDDGQASHSD